MIIGGFSGACRTQEIEAKIRLDRPGESAAEVPYVRQTSRLCLAPEKTLLMAVSIGYLVLSG